MAKGDDVARKKKNKSLRKKMRNESSSVPARIAAIIATKKRRKSGKRRMCEGMCFSLPTPDDPFNDSYGKDFSKQEKKTIRTSQAVGVQSVIMKRAPLSKVKHSRDYEKICSLEQKKKKIKNSKNEQKKSSTVINTMMKRTIELQNGKVQLHGKDGVTHDQEAETCEMLECPSKFLILCLNSIQDAMQHDKIFSSSDDKPLFANIWGIEFWKFYSLGKNILETSGGCATPEQIAWMTSTAADTIVREEKEGLSFNSPFLLFLVSSQDKTAKVRSVCKPLKALGIHTVSLHSGASLEHQIYGLKSCEPEFLVSTPGRLLELVSLKAIDISGVRFLVVDGLEALHQGCRLDVVKSIRESIHGNLITVVFSESLNYTSIPTLKHLLPGSICRLSLNDSIMSRSAGIIQSIHFCASEDEKFTNAIELLDQAVGAGEKFQDELLSALIVIGGESKFHELISVLKSKGFSSLTNSMPGIPAFGNRETRQEVSVMYVEHIKNFDLGKYEIVIIPDFAISEEGYTQILSRMARHSVNGMLHSFLSKENAPYCGPLIEILRRCGQAVPEALTSLLATSSVSE